MLTGMVSLTRMSDVLEVLTLQSFDDEAASLRAALADVELRLQGNPELDFARTARAEAQAAVAVARREQRRLEGEVDQLRSRIAPEEKRLYDGSVKNPKELGNIQHELEGLTAQRTKLEDQLLELLASIEALAAEDTRAAGHVDALEAAWQQQSEQLASQAARLRESIARADRQRTTQKAKIPARTLQLYDDLRRRKGGLAVARMKGGACTGCRVSVPHALRRKVLSPIGLAQCPNCERLLTVG